MFKGKSALPLFILSLINFGLWKDEYITDCLDLDKFPGWFCVMFSDVADIICCLWFHNSNTETIGRL